MSKFKITGLGEYRTRGGEKVTITEAIKGSTALIGYLGDSGHATTWQKDGSYWEDKAEDIKDIIGPWVEPTVDKPTTPDHAKLIASLELAAHHNECAELLLEAARAIRELTASQTAVRVSWANP